MPKIQIYKQTGEKSGTLTLNEKVFNAEYNEPLIHQVVVAQLNNKRQGTKSTLTRAEVRGGGRKPHRQKGTGRARAGSTRSPLWTGGGVIFAPKPRDFSQKVNKQAKRVALCSAFSEKVRNSELVLLDEIKLNDAKTKEMAAIMEALKLEKSVLLITAEGSENIIRASANLPNVKTIEASLINVYDLVANQRIVATVAGIKLIEANYAEKE
ncbi:MAG: 50S ribosomal protein L4 [Firmicutes bacterium]|nr:50S ribosomal protein L4 [Bacillota bacterium]